jgi:hypothetical protein
MTITTGVFKRGEALLFYLPLSKGMKIERIK